MNGDYKQATEYLTVLEDGFRYEFLGGCTDQRACISDVKTRNAYLQIYTGGPLGSGRRNSSSRGYSHGFAALS